MAVGGLLPLNRTLVYPMWLGGSKTRRQSLRRGSNKRFKTSGDT